eukprot:gnl/TRDRNA2_/TRDRNA2_194747_c0_seq1.p1 gnl/TRDRNA2_/TRDRNA2_194747_c0~~gnl/TRDRNA2_/TRDRNA2_194747_c0_seq1.p1  ORF type:complete len:288 (-),score=36.06 gnl/TRDRNA2_/TRDRNA2_194747_c0_seq1:28-807(-)
MADASPLVGDDPNYDKRYPDWHSWLPVGAQNCITYLIYSVFVAYAALYLLIKKFDVIEDEEGKIFKIVEYLPLVNLALAVILLFGMISKVTMPVKMSGFFIILNFSLIAYSPRLAVPIVSGVMGPFIIYVLILAVWQEGVVQWGKFGVPGYMSIVAPWFGATNSLVFKGYCSGYIPRFVYYTMWMVIMVSTTIKEIGPAEKTGDLSKFDYQVVLPVYKRLVAFRLGVLVVALGTSVMFVQDSLLDLLKEGVWECTPAAW